MGNRKARAWQLRTKRGATWDRLRLAPWRPDDARRAVGSGTPRVQIIRSPSFDPASFWEVCQLKADWVLYRSRVIDGWYPGPLTVQGYEAVAFGSDDLRRYFDRIVALSLPVAPHLNGMGGLDGTVTWLTLFGDLFSGVRFEWWSDHPPGWSPLVEVAEEMLAAFERAGGA